MAVGGRSQMSNKQADKEAAEAAEAAHQPQPRRTRAKRRSCTLIDDWPKDSMSNTRSSVRMPCLPVHFDGRQRSSCRRVGRSVNEN